MTPLLFCFTGWMEKYRGLDAQQDELIGGGAYPDEHGVGGEICNFVECDDGNTYGFFESGDHQTNISRLGASADDEWIDGVNVVWMAASPDDGKRKIVGWYADARVYRHRQLFGSLPSQQHARDRLVDYKVVAPASSAVLLPLTDRHLIVKKSRSWSGQAQCWYPDTSVPEVAAFDRQVRTLIAGEAPALNVQKAAVDTNQRLQVEARAIAVVTEYFEAAPKAYSIKSVERDNVGWDLEARRNGEQTLHLEVKGLSGTQARIGLTPNEYRILQDHIAGIEPDYRLCIVTSALSNAPRLQIVQFSPETREWRNTVTGVVAQLGIDPVESAFISVTTTE